MNGERAVVEEIRGAVHELQTVEKVETSLLTLEVHADHRPRRLTKLLLSERMKLIILQSDIVDKLDGLERLQLLGQCQRIRRLHTIAGIEGLQAHGLKESSLRGHVRTEIEQQLTLDRRREAFRVLRAIIDDQSAQRGSPTTDIFGRGDDLDVYAQVLCGEHRERDRCRVSHERDLVGVGYAGQRLKVSDLHLRVRDDLYKDAACVIVDSLLHLPDIRQVRRVQSHSELPQGTVEEVEGVAEHVGGRHHVLALSRESEHDIADSRHATVEG